MGGAQSLEDLDLSDEDSDSESHRTADDAETYLDASERTPKTPSSSSIHEVEEALQALKLKYGSPSPNPTAIKNPVKLYLHVGGNTPNAKWVVYEKATSYDFVKGRYSGSEDGGSSEDVDGGFGGSRCWVLKVGTKVRARVGGEMGLKYFGTQRRVDFVARGVWAMKFANEEDYRVFIGRF